jgi:DNA-binding NtrC family response regulator
MPPEALRGGDVHPPALRVISGPSRILLAGADAERRATLLDELSRTLPESTVFEQADAVCEALEHASGSRMAFIAGDLDDAPAESLLQTLAHRHPELPVLIVDGPAEVHGPHAVYNDELRLRHG